MAKEKKYNVRRKGDPSFSEKGALDEIKDAIIVDVIIPTTTEFLGGLAEYAKDKGLELAKEKFFPYIKLKFRQAVPIVKAKFKAIKERIKNRKRKKKKTTDVDVKVTVEEQKLYTKKEVEQIMTNMRYAVLYIASGIKELSNAVVTDADDPKEQARIEEKLKELTSDDIKNIIDFMLEPKNKYLLDKETLKTFKAFKHGELIVDGELVPIKNFIETEIKTVTDGINNSL